MERLIKISIKVQLDDKTVTAGLKGDECDVDKLFELLKNQIKRKIGKKSRCTPSN